MLHIEDLHAFCTGHEHLLIYGAGHFAGVVLPYLQKHGHIAEACIVSGKPGGRDFMGLPYFKVSEYPVQAGERYGILLTLQEMFHADARAMVEKTFGSMADVFALRDRDIGILAQIYRTERMYELLESPEELSADCKRDYEIRAERILAQHKRIYLRFIDMHNIGCVVAWVYWCCQRRCQQDGLYWLFWPSVHPSHTDMELKGANAYLLGKMQEPGIEVVSEQNLGFWRYLYQREPGVFIIDTGFSLADWVKLLNSFAWLRGSQVTGTFINFTPEEERRGREHATKMGLKAPFMCFSVRDNLYRRHIQKYVTDVADRSGKYRNYPLTVLQPVMEKMADFGLQAVRMGALVGESIDWPNVVDYAHDYRTEFMDAWLFAHCSFFACTPSGIQSIPQLFSKPHAMFNLAIQTTRNDYEMFTSSERDLAIMQKYWLEKEQRFLSLREMLTIETNESLHTYSSIGAFTAYDKMGAVPVKNSEEEVAELLQEMVLRLQGKMVYTEEDNRLQARYRDIVDSFPLRHNFPFVFRMGAHFLRTNPWLLK